MGESDVEVTNGSSSSDGAEIELPGSDSSDKPSDSFDEADTAFAEESFRMGVFLHHYLASLLADQQSIIRSSRRCSRH